MHRPDEQDPSKPGRYDCTVGWEEPEDDGGDEIYLYTLQVSRYDVRWEPSLGDLFDGFRPWETVHEGPAKVMEHALVGLLPDNTYRVRVSCLNSVGASGWSEPWLTFDTPSAEGEGGGQAAARPVPKSWLRVPVPEVLMEHTKLTGGTADDFMLELAEALQVMMPPPPPCSPTVWVVLPLPPPRHIRVMPQRPFALTSPPPPPPLLPPRPPLRPAPPHTHTPPLLSPQPHVQQLKAVFKMYAAGTASNLSGGTEINGLQFGKFARDVGVSSGLNPLNGERNGLTAVQGVQVDLVYQKAIADEIHSRNAAWQAAQGAQATAADAVAAAVDAATTRVEKDVSEMGCREFVGALIRLAWLQLPKLGGVGARLAAFLNRAVFPALVSRLQADDPMAEQLQRKRVRAILDHYDRDMRSIFRSYAAADMDIDAQVRRSRAPAPTAHTRAPALRAFYAHPPRPSPVAPPRRTRWTRSTSLS